MRQLWRERAKRDFSHLTRDLAKREYTIYQLFFDLLPMAKHAHRVNNKPLLRRIYSFADWCLHSSQKDLWNPAGVAFYEHLVDDPETCRGMVDWITPSAVEQVWGLWEDRLPSKELNSLHETLARLKKAPKKGSSPSRAQPRSQRHTS